LRLNLGKIVYYNEYNIKPNMGQNIH